MFVLSLNKEMGARVRHSVGLKDSGCASSHMMTKFLGIQLVHNWYTIGIQLIYKSYRNVLTGSVAGSTSISQHLASKRQRLQDRRLSLLDSGPLPASKSTPH